MSTDLSLRSHVEHVALLREEIRQRTASLIERVKAYETAIAPDRATIEGLKRALEAAEADVRGLGLVAYELDGTKQPCAGVSIAIVNDIAIDEPTTLAYLDANAATLGHCIKRSVDTGTVKKLVSAGLTIPGVTITPRPQVRIASDLSTALQPQEWAA